MTTGDSARLAGGFVGFDFGQQVLQLCLALLKLTKDRFDGAPLLNHFTELLPKRLLLVSDFLQPFIHISGFVSACLQRRPVLSFCKSVLKPGDGFDGIAADEVPNGPLNVVL